MIFSFAASAKVRLKVGDISNAFFQGKEMDRGLLIRPPKGGLPDPEYADGETMILARVPIYGTTDAGRKFWERLRGVIVEAGFRENQISKALYSFTDKHGKVIALICTHVDDMLWAAKPEEESAINN